DHGPRAPWNPRHRPADVFDGPARSEPPELLETRLVDLHDASRESARVPHRHASFHVLTSRAMRKAAAAARPPMNVVCSALRAGGVPVKRPLTLPKASSARSVVMTDIQRPALGADVKK